MATQLLRKVERILVFIQALFEIFVREMVKIIARQSRKLVTQTVEEVNGYNSYLNAFQIRLTVRHSSEVAFKYRITSNYDESQSEVGSNNYNKARPEVDFVVAEGVIEFDPRELICFVPVRAIDDFSIEDSESLQIEIFDRTGGLVGLWPGINTRSCSRRQ